MRLLEEKILSDGKAVNEDILRVDTFINHQVDPLLMSRCAREFSQHFKGRGITKIVTIESSGIAPALLTALEMNIPMVITKKQPSKVLNDNLYQTMVASFTKGTNYELTLSKDVISENDHVLIIDDFLANGEAVTGVVRLLRMAHATVAGIGILIEKAFQPGRGKLEDAGFEIFSLARIGSMSKDNISFI